MSKLFQHILPHITGLRTNWMSKSINPTEAYFSVNNTLHVEIYPLLKFQVFNFVILVKKMLCNAFTLSSAQVRVCCNGSELS